MVKMSGSVVKEVLLLLQDDLQPTGNSSKTKKGSKDAQRLGSKNMRGKRKKQEFKRFKSAIEKFQEGEKLAKAEKERRLNTPPAKPSKSAVKVFEHHINTFYRKEKKESESDKKEETTVFTDQDFDLFEKEYDF